MHSSASEQWVLSIKKKDEGVLSQESIAAVEQRLSDSIRSTTLPRWAPQALQASPQAAAYMTAAYARMLVLLSATASLEQLLSPDIISDLVVRHLLLQQVCIVPSHLISTALNKLFELLNKPVLSHF
jgi:hypothetical protein